MPATHTRPKPIVLLILDGWGLAPAGPGNAITLASPENFNRYWSAYPKATLTASGEAVGLPRGEVGNTETGHLNLGAGKIVYQDLPRINMAIADGGFFQNPSLISAANHAKKHQSTLHLMGLVGAGGVHSNIEHLFALLRFCKEQQLANVAIHAFTDGRDSPPTSAPVYIEQLNKEFQRHGLGFVASVMGRYFAMDRDLRWNRTQKAYLTLTQGQGLTAPTPEQAIQNSYQKDKTDEFIEPTVIVDQNQKPKALIKANDAVIFFNYRIDRPRQLTKAFVFPDFTRQAAVKTFDPYAIKYYGKHEVELPQAQTPFDRGPQIQNLFFVTMTEYEKNLPTQVVIPPDIVDLPLARVFAEKNFRQLKITETEKERFVTYYFNGQRETPFPGEERIIIPSPRVPTYDQQPEMSSHELTQTLVARIQSKIYDLIVANYPNADMVGHTGNLQAAIKACQIVDQHLAKIIPTCQAVGGACLITSDHGNAEDMINPQSGQVDTEHSGNPVPFLIIPPRDMKIPPRNLGAGILADVAPTILGLAGIPKPATMSGRNLLTSLR
jgi:2,3-bisphosphoglycerate-independent phosphoglycerate mutase